MALTYTNFSSFEEVVNHYEKIKPLRGKANEGEDIRPLGDRRRKWERIVKVSRNCYALTDGWHPGDMTFPFWHASDHEASLKDMAFYAPIVWRKHRDGSVTVHLRNGWGPYNHNRRYAFLYRHTPKGLRFIQTQKGKQYISIGGLYRDALYLAKGRTTPKLTIQEHKKIVEQQRALGHAPNSWQQKWLRWMTPNDDKATLVFKKVGDNWEHVSGTGVSEESTTPRVDKLTKAKFRAHLSKFFEWGMVMSPLLPLGDNDYAREMSIKFTDAVRGGMDEAWSKPIQPKLVRKVIQDEDHPARLAMWVTFAHTCTDGWALFNPTYLCQVAQTKEEVARVRSRFNQYVNKLAGFIKTK